MKEKLFITISGFVVSYLLLLSGCTNNPGFIARDGSYFGSVNEMKFLDIDGLGKHRSFVQKCEANGMIYTCKGGFIDIGHLREAADRTKYLAEFSYENIINEKTEFSFQIIDPSWYFVKIGYPSDWQNISEEDKKNAAKEISLILGQYFAFTTTSWHEIATWFGYKKNGFFSESVSSFSWEDAYSDLLGVILAARALKMGDNFNERLTICVYDELKELQAQPADIGRQAKKKITGKWYSGDKYFWVTMNKRNFDMGLDDGYITPWLVPDICGQAEAKLYPVPDLSVLNKYGMKIKFELEPREMEKALILKIIYPDLKETRIEPEIHFAIILEEIKRQAIEKYGQDVNKPIL